MSGAELCLDLFPGLLVAGIALDVGEAFVENPSLPAGDGKKASLVLGLYAFP